VIKDLKRQVTFNLVVCGQHIAKYIADATYTDVDTGELIVEDTKSPATKKLSEYRMKKALMKALFGHVILET
jgi:hypothetical protein